PKRKPTAMTSVIGRARSTSSCAARRPRHCTSRQRVAAARTAMMSAAFGAIRLTGAEASIAARNNQASGPFSDRTAASFATAGAGKGTIARALAARLGYRHIDTGAMYRALAWNAARLGVDLADEAAVAALGERAHFDVEGGRIAIDGHDVKAAIRTPEIDKAAAAVARHAAVRRVIVDRQ